MIYNDRLKFMQLISGETTARDNEEPQTRVTREEYSYETPDREPIDVDSDDDKSFRRKSVKSITSRSSTRESVHDQYRYY